MDAKKLKGKTYDHVAVYGFLAENLNAKALDLKVAEMILNTTVAKLETMSPEAQARHEETLESTMEALEDYFVSMFKYVRDFRNRQDS